MKNGGLSTKTEENVENRAGKRHLPGLSFSIGRRLYGNCENSVISGKTRAKIKNIWYNPRDFLANKCLKEFISHVAQGGRALENFIGMEHPAELSGEGKGPPLYEGYRDQGCARA